MYDNIKKLEQQIDNIAVGYLFRQERKNIELVKKIVPQIQEFVFWFLNGNRYGIEEKLYKDLSNNLIYILEDILEALEQGDRVLLHDALTYGLKEYLLLFLQKKEDNINEYI